MKSYEIHPLDHRSVLRDITHAARENTLPRRRITVYDLYATYGSVEGSRFRRCLVPGNRFYILRVTFPPPRVFSNISTTPVRGFFNMDDPCRALHTGFLLRHFSCRCSRKRSRKEPAVSISTVLAKLADPVLFSCSFFSFSVTRAFSWPSLSYLSLILEVLFSVSVPPDVSPTRQSDTEFFEGRSKGELSSLFK